MPRRAIFMLIGSPPLPAGGVVSDNRQPPRHAHAPGAWKDGDEHA
jgi:hypothetical protein